MKRKEETMEAWLAFLTLVAMEKNVPSELQYYARLMHRYLVDGLENPEIQMLGKIFELKVEGKIVDLSYYAGANGSWIVNMADKSYILAPTLEELFSRCVNQGLLEPLP
jgi:hypothetical protein